MGALFSFFKWLGSIPATCHQKLLQQQRRCTSLGLSFGVCGVTCIQEPSQHGTHMKEWWFMEPLYWNPSYFCQNTWKQFCFRRSKKGARWTMQIEWLWFERSSQKHEVDQKFTFSTCACYTPISQAGNSAPRRNLQHCFAMSNMLPVIFGSENSHQFRTPGEMRRTNTNRKSDPKSCPFRSSKSWHFLKTGWR